MEGPSRFHDLVNQYLDGGASSQDLAELGRFVLADRAAASTFVRQVQFELLLKATLDVETHHKWVDHFLERVHQLDLLNDLDDAVGPVTPIPSQPTHLRPRPRQVGMLGRSRSWSFRLSNVRLSVQKVAWLSAILLVGVIVTVVALRQAAKLPADRTITDDASHSADKPELINLPIATLEVAAGCTWEGEAVPPAPGDWLPANKKLKLKSGLATIVFQNGAKAILEGPAVLDLHSCSNVALSRGKITVTIENPEAKGFQVDAPGMRFTDFGTEFGVMVAPSGEQELHVFRGTVMAEQRAETAENQSNRDDGHAAVGAHPLILKAHDAIRVAAAISANDVKQIQMIAADETRFVRALPKPFPLFGTGMGIDYGAMDPHWEIAAISTETNYKPRPAVVAIPLEFYVRGEWDTGRWIARTKLPENLPGGCRMTFRTRFDLSGFDPSTAQIGGRITADDWVVEMRLNGVAVPLPKGLHDNMLFKKWIDFQIAQGFVEGQNTLEIVVENGIQESNLNGVGLRADGKTAARMPLPPTVVNGMALRVDCKGSARPRTAPGA